MGGLASSNIFGERTMKQTAKLTRSLEASPKYGKISRMILPNKSKIYVSNKGWNLVTPDGFETNLPFEEIALALHETKKQGYANRIIGIIKIRRE
jgi:hypothetical protein